MYLVKESPSIPPRCNLGNTIPFQFTVRIQNAPSHIRSQTQAQLHNQITLSSLSLLVPVLYFQNLVSVLLSAVIMGKGRRNVLLIGNIAKQHNTHWACGVFKVLIFEAHLRAPWVFSSISILCCHLLDIGNTSPIPSVAARIPSVT